MTNPLSESLLIVPYGRMAGATDFVARHRRAEPKINIPRPLAAVAHGIASHDRLNDVMNALPAGLFSERFIAWIDD